MSNRKESFLTKIAFFCNKILALVTILAYILPFLAPKLFPFLSVLTLAMPLFLIVNFAFFILWVLQFKRKALLSAIVLLIGVTFVSKFYKFSESQFVEEETDIKLMSYNVRLFNLYEWLPEKKVPELITDVIQNYNPDILCLQEFSPSKRVRLRNFPHKYIQLHSPKSKSGHAIYSKFPIINKGEIDFPNSFNNVIFTDLLIKGDTVRVYSMHLQSIKISADIHEKLDENKSKFIFRRISQAFSEQQLQAEMIKVHYDQCKHSKIICGDMNNSAFSYVYRTIKGNLKDAFEEAGSGFGKSYNFDFYPARIDYVFTEPNFMVKELQTDTKVKLSDHFPVYARLALSN